MYKVIDLKYTFLICLLSFSFLQAQINPDKKRTYHWYFGDKSGLNFTLGNPIIDLNSQMHQSETSSVMSDTLGNLLFYSDGDTIWNKNHQIMFNGTGLINCESSSQGGLIFKKPNSNSLYYIFTNDCGENNGIDGIHYSLIDMNLNGGLGDVSLKNALLFAPSTEKMAAVYHCNKKDIWFVSQIRNSNSFCAYLISESGISNTPVISNIGSMHNDDSFLLAGSLKFSPNGDKMAVVYSTYPNGLEELFDFNTANGTVSNFISLPADTSEYGVSFSPDNTKLYIESGGGGGVGNKIFQYDLSLITPTLIIASRNKIFSMPSGVNNPVLALELAPDGKIYGARYDLDTLSVINSPNNYSTSCNFVHNAISLQGRKSRETLPQFIEDYFSINTQTTCATKINKLIIEDIISIYPNPAKDLLNLYSVENNIELKITNSMGIEIEFENNFINRVLTLDIHSFYSGIYFIQIKSKNNTTIKKIIVNN